MIGVYERKSKLHVELTSKVEGKWSALRAKHFIPGEGGPCYPLNRKQSAFDSWFAVLENGVSLFIMSEIKTQFLDHPGPA